ncbi:MAG: hypothetical protein ABI335_04270 [Polyangiaceae bacterium]
MRALPEASSGQMTDRSLALDKQSGAMSFRVAWLRLMDIISPSAARFGGKKPPNPLRSLSVCSNMDARETRL